jgi:hypothetical protein
MVEKIPFDDSYMVEGQNCKYLVKRIPGVVDGICPGLDLNQSGDESGPEDIIESCKAFSIFQACQHVFSCECADYEKGNDCKHILLGNYINLADLILDNKPTVAHVKGLWNPVGITTSNTETQLGSENDSVQQKSDENIPALQKLAQRYLANNSENAATVQLLMSKNTSPHLRDLQAFQECIRRSEQDLLMLKALLNQDSGSLTSSIPEFNEHDLQVFGQRAAYQAQLRSPWSSTNRRSLQQQDLNKQISENRAYNQARGGLPVCTTCTSIEGHVITGHMTGTAWCPHHVHVNPYNQHTRTAAEMISAHAALEADLMHGRL